MKLPINCPFCNNIMETDFTIRENYPMKTCTKHLSHYIRFVADNYDEITSIRIEISEYIYAIWYFINKRIIIQDTHDSSYLLDKLVELPFFEPDFSQGYKILTDKIKLYITMS